MFKNKKAVFFDMDGTLIDSVGIWNDVDARLLSKLGARELPSEEIQSQRDQLLRLYSKAENPYLEYCRVLGTKYSADGAAIKPQEILQLRYEIAHDYLKHVVDYKKDAEKLLARLKDMGLTLVIATTTRKKNMDIYRRENKNIMEKGALDTFFSAIYTREDAKEIKPNPEIYVRIMEELHLKPQDCIIVEDSLIGVEAAGNAGIEVIAVYDKYSAHEWEEICRRADYSFEEFCHVLAALDAEEQ